MKLAMNGTITFTGNVLTDIDIAIRAGYGAIELSARKTEQMLAAGLSMGTLLDALAPLEVCNVGAVLDVERRGTRLPGLVKELETIAGLAERVGAPMIQVCTGPVDRDLVGDFHARSLGDDERYRGALGAQLEEAIAMTAEALALAARIASEHGLCVCVEPLAWTPLARLDDILTAIAESGAPNVGICTDFWHLWAAGDSPDAVSTIPAELIKMVQVADSTAFDRAAGPADQRRDRDVLVGGGVIPVQQWIEAVKSTGYDGWYSVELFSTRAKQLDPVKLASTMRGLLEVMIA